MSMDKIAYSVAKKKAVAAVESGVQSHSVTGNTLHFEFKDGTSADMTFSQPQDGRDGADGFSPSATVEQTLAGANITMRDKDGTTTAVIRHGANGQDGATIQSIRLDEFNQLLVTLDNGRVINCGIVPTAKGDTGETGATGADGFSPSARVDNATTGATITLRDKDGTTTAFIRNGADGISPTAAVTKEGGVTSLQVTDKDGVHATTILDGEKGEKGVGIYSIVKTGSAGLVDTYTVRFTDNTTTTFEVTNGANITKMSDLTNDAGFIANTVNNLVNYYTKEQTYTKDEISELLRNVGAGLSTKIVQTLPTEEISGTTIYLIANQSGDSYTQYMHIGGEWAVLGTTSIDLSGYYTKEQVDGKLDAYVTAAALATALAGYAQKSELGAAAFSNSYYDLDDLPVIPDTSALVTQNQMAVALEETEAKIPTDYRKTTDPIPYADISGHPNVAAQIAEAVKAHADDEVAHVTQADRDAWDAKSEFSGSYNDLTDKPTRARVAETGSYNDLSDRPTHAKVADTGQYSDLAGKPDLKPVATSGAYSDLTGTPTVDELLDADSTNAIQNKTVTEVVNRIGGGAAGQVEAFTGDANNLKKTGFYLVSASTCTNLPDNFTSAGMQGILQVIAPIATATAGLKQILYNTGSGNNEKWERLRTSTSAWGTWQRIGSNPTVNTQVAGSAPVWAKITLAGGGIPSGTGTLILYSRNGEAVRLGMGRTDQGAVSFSAVAIKDFYGTNKITAIYQDKDDPYILYVYMNQWCHLLDAEIHGAPGVIVRSIQKLSAAPDLTNTTQITIRLAEPRALLSGRLVDRLITTQCGSGVTSATIDFSTIKSNYAGYVYNGIFNIRVSINTGESVFLQVGLGYSVQFGGFYMNQLSPEVGGITLSIDKTTGIMTVSGPSMWSLQVTQQC